MQQNQQKYQTQQAGYDRLFQLGRDAQQNQFQFLRDTQQAVNHANMQDAQNKFQTGRDKAQFDQQQQQQEAARQRAFMDEARKQSSGMIMQDIQNGNYDPATARKLQQTLVDESEALGNKTLDATQRAEALESIRGHRAYLGSLRIEKPPAPSPQEQFDKSIVTGADGTQYRQNAKGDFEPLPQQPKRPSSAAEAFGADPKLRDKYYAEGKEIEMAPVDGVKPALTPELRQKAIARAEQLWEQDNIPPSAPELPGGAPPAAPGESRSILEGPTTQPPVPGMPPAPATPQTAALPDPGMPPAPGARPPSMSAEEYHNQMTSQGYTLVEPGDGRRPFYYKDSRVSPTQGLPLINGEEQPIAPSTPPGSMSAEEYDKQMTSQGYALVTPEGGGNPYYYKDGTPPPPAGQPTPAAPEAAANANPWTEVASGGEQASPIPAAPTPAPQASAAQPAAPAPTSQPPVAPNFSDLVSKTRDSEERRVLMALQGIYSGQTPEVQSAIGVILNDQSSLPDLKAANDYLRSAGIDIDQLAKYQPQGGGRKGKAK